MMKEVKYVIAKRGYPQFPFICRLVGVGSQSGGCTIKDSNTSFQPADVINRNSNCMLLPKVSKFTYRK